MVEIVWEFFKYFGFVDGFFVKVFFVGIVIDIVNFRFVNLKMFKFVFEMFEVFLV